MKMESPLEVLSRAASIVQGEDKPKHAYVADRNFGSSTDSGFEDEGIPNHSPPTSPTGIAVPERSSNLSERRQRSPKRQLSQTDKTQKRIKLESLENDATSSPPVLTIERNAFAGGRPSPSHPRFHTIPTTRNMIPILPLENNHKKHIVVTSSKTYFKQSVSPPPLIAISEKTASFAMKIPSYESLFPRPSVISTSSPVSHFAGHYAESKNCSSCNNGCYTTFSSAYPALKKEQRVVIPQGFELPTVDDHFRKSLGDKYVTKCQHLDERPSSVDEHFAKALGTKWYKLEYGRCMSS